MVLQARLHFDAAFFRGFHYWLLGALVSPE
jgi:hypothetical protein